MALSNFCDKYENVISGDRRQISGLPFNLPDITLIKDSFKIIKIEPQFKYRPDKLAQHLWDDQNLSYVLNYINGFNDIKKYVNGRYIYYVETKDELKRLGLIK